VRSAEGLIIQYIYGEDGVDPAKSVGGKPVDLKGIETYIKHKYGGE